jgi:hypothetical protein
MALIEFRVLSAIFQNTLHSDRQDRLVYGLDYSGIFLTSISNIVGDAKHLLV